MPCGQCGDIIPAEVGRCPSCGTRMARRDFRAMGSAVFMLLGFNAFLGLGSGVSLLQLSRRLDLETVDSYSPRGTVRHLDPYSSALTISLVLAGVTAVAFLAWMWRAHRYAPAVRYARGWVVAGWVLPIANLWLPPRLVYEIWAGDAPQLTRHRIALVVLAWWAALLSSIALEWAFVRAGAASLAEARGTVRLGLLGAGMHALAAVLCMAAVFHITLVRGESA